MEQVNTPKYTLQVTNNTILVTCNESNITRPIFGEDAMALLQHAKDNYPDFEKIDEHIAVTVFK